MKLEGKVAIVTGGGAGIGQGIVHRLAEEGADVAVVDINRDTAKKVADEVKALGRKSLAIEADVTDSKQIAQLVQETIDTFGKIDILVNVVGPWGDIGQIKQSQRFVDMTEEEWDVNYELTFKTQVFMSQAVAPYFIKQKSGKIINISSVDSNQGGMGGGVGANGIMKMAALHFTQSLAGALAGDNINVNTVGPGNVFTPRVARNTSREDFERNLASRTPLKRTQTPEDIGRAVAFLASEDARNITGQTLLVNGGRVML